MTAPNLMQSIFDVIEERATDQTTHDAVIDLLTNGRNRDEIITAALAWMDQEGTR